MKQVLLDLVTNRILLAAVFSWAISQGSKILYEGFRYGFSLERLSGGGGMPSAHTATVIGLTSATGAVCGLGGFEFPMALFFAIIVIYDAMNVRYETGQQAKVMNRQREQRIQKGEDPLYEKPFAEKMGHTLPEIIVGGIIGLVVGLVTALI